MLHVHSAGVLDSSITSNWRLSRKCRVQRKAERLPLLLEAIREEIEKTCESLITDGSRPFRVNWTGYGEDCLTVTVNTHHKIPPMTNEYWNNRERCLEAISMAAMKTGVEFAIPRSVLVREGEEKSVRDES